MPKTKLVLGLAVLAAAVIAAPNVRGQDDDNDDNSGNRKILLVDDCDPSDPNWAPVGCLQDDGDVTAAEFNALLTSPLYDNNPGPPNPPTDPLGGLFLVGHPSWRIDVAHALIEAGKKITVTNVGGRPHTFTEVAQFGGGVVPPLNVGTQPAPECAASVRMVPGDEARLTASGEGIHKFQCCFHPWMRATVRVVEKADDQN
jgi:plastocyanin